MTFCLGMNVHEGIVGIADTRVLSGSECITARKVTVYQQDGQAMFLMTSELRSLRDKALTYFDEVMAEAEQPFDRLFKAVNAFATQIRRVAQEDKEALVDSGLHFNIYTLVGGQLANDWEHRLYLEPIRITVAHVMLSAAKHLSSTVNARFFAALRMTAPCGCGYSDRHLVYPQGNWVEIGQGTPYHIIGASGYGKPILDRTLKHHDSMRFALKVGCLAFDSTRISAADVDFPIDIILYARNSYHIVEHCYEKGDLLEMTSWWQERLRRSVHELPSRGIDRVFSQFALVEENSRLASV